MHALTIGIGAAEARRMPPDALAEPMNMLSDTLDDLFAGRFPSFSWRALMRTPSPSKICGTRPTSP
jgi:hypothetical protein